MDDRDIILTAAGLALVMAIILGWAMFSGCGSTTCVCDSPPQLDRNVSIAMPFSEVTRESEGDSDAEAE